MPFENVLGQQPAIETLRHALTTGRVHHAYRFEGPAGVGKELCAFELAKELVCGANASRRRVDTFSDDDPRVPQHPDVVLVQRGLYGKLLTASEVSGISVEQIRRIVLTRAGYPPHEGEALVFIVRDADELTTSAANALLKTLEEPTPRTHFILLTSRPKRLLDTILSRTLAVRFGPLSDSIVGTILERRGLDPAVAPLAAGSVARAIELADEELVETRTAFVRSALHAVEAGDFTGALALAESRPADKHDLIQNLEFLAAHFVGVAKRELATSEHHAGSAAHQHRTVLQALAELERNAQPGLVLEAMLLRLRSA